MSLFALQFAVSQVVINDRAVHAAIDKGERETLTEIGMEIDELATSRLVARDRASRPGEAPSVHSFGSRSLRNIQSSYDPATHSVIIGSVLLSGSFGDPLPGRLEFGDGKIAARPNMGPTLDRFDSGGTLRRAWTASIGAA